MDIGGINNMWDIWEQFNKWLDHLLESITKIIKNQINLVPAGRREFKPVETMKSVVDESGRLQSLDCN